MWGQVWQSISGFFMWILNRRDVRENRDRSDFQMVTVGYDKLTALLQTRVEGLIAEIEEMKEREDKMRIEHDEERRDQKAVNERIGRLLRQCRNKESIMTLQMEKLQKELTEAQEQIKKLSKRMDDHDSGEMKGLSQ